MNTFGTQAKLHGAEVAAAASLWLGHAVWAWHPEMVWILLLAVLPTWLLCLRFWVREPEKLLLAGAWIAPLSLETTDLLWADLTSLLPALLMLVAWAWKGFRLPGKSLLKDFVALSMLAWMIWICFTSGLSLDPGKSWIHAAQVSVPMLAMMVYGSVLASRRAEFAGRYCLAMLSILVYAMILSPEQPKLSGIPFFQGDNTLSGALLPVVFLFPAAVSPRKLAVLASLAVAFWIFFISRGAFLGIMAGVLAFAAVWTGNKTIRWGILVSGVAALAFLLWPRQATTPVLEQAVFSKVNQFSNEERLMRWEVALRMTAEHPWTGVGTGCFAPEFKHYLRTDAEVAKISYWHGWTGGAHQIWLGAAAETGWPGLVLLLTWMGGVLWRGLRQALNGDTFSKLAWAGWIAMMVHLQVEDLLTTDACLWAFAWIAMSFIFRGKPLDFSTKN